MGMKLPIVLALLCSASAALADGRPAPYSLPWQLRSTAVTNSVRSDTAVAFYEDSAGRGGTTIASMLGGTWKVRPDLGFMLRAGAVQSSPPTGDSASSLVSPLVGATYAPRLGPAPLRLAAALGFSLPIGMGGGNHPDAAIAAADRSGIAARSSLDNAMFAVNYTAIAPAVDVAWVDHGLTVQAELAVLELIRVRGSAMEKDSARTNLITGLHAGYFVHPAISLSGELRYQRWLSTPAAVTANPAMRDFLTFAVGVRAHFKVGEKTWLRPGIAYARGLDDPMVAQHYDILQVDLPVTF
jgi:hypothetical protein